MDKIHEDKEEESNLKDKGAYSRTKGLTAVMHQNLDKENGVLAQAEVKDEAHPHQDPKMSLPEKTRDTPENKVRLSWKQEPGSQLHFKPA